MSETEVCNIQQETFSARATLSEDRMKLYLTAEPGPALLEILKEEEPEGEMEKHEFRKKLFQRDQLTEALEAKLKIERMERGVLNKIVEKLNSGSKSEKLLIARGKSPGKGLDGKIVFLVKVYGGQQEPYTDDKGFTDFKVVHLFDNVTKGQEIARIYPPRAGKPGLDVFGEEIDSIPGSEANFTPEESVTLSRPEGSKSDYQSLSALLDGFVINEHSRIQVKDVLHVKQDLDFKTGNIDFIGGVKISGDVMTGFSIQASGNIEINGSLRDAILISTAGDVRINEGAFGDPQSFVVSAKRLYLKFAHQLQASVHKDLWIKKYVEECLLRVQGTVQAPSGKLVGGSLMTPYGVEAGHIGNTAGISTVINLCLDIEATPEYQEIETNLARHSKALELLSLHLGPFKDNPDRIVFLNEKMREKISTLRNKLIRIQKSLESLEKKRGELLAKGTRGNNPRVNFLKAMHQGVIILQGEVVFAVEETLLGPRTVQLNPKKGEFEVVDLVPLEPLVKDEE